MVLEGKKTYQKVVPVKPEVQPAVIKFLETSPTLVGEGIRSDMTGTEECYSMICGKKVVFPKYVEIGTLATVLGWGMGSTNMPTIALVTTGLVLNKTVSAGDKSWGNTTAAERWLGLPQHKGWPGKHWRSTGIGWSYTCPRTRTMTTATSPWGPPPT